MRAIPRDPLLAIARAILYFLMGVMALGGAACLLGFGTLAVMHGEVVRMIAEDVDPAHAENFFRGLAAVLPLAAILLGLVFAMLLLLKRIVDTVALGDPFVPENAARLQRMAWLALGVQLVALPLGAAGMWLQRFADEPEVRGGFDGVSGNGLLLMLILFILARVFRKGAEMRAELEGTV